ncbi:MAG: TIGR03545 family protein [Pirellulales bacterium]
MIRWSYLVPRLLVMLIVTVGLYVGFNPLARWGLITVGQRLTGARVDVGHVNSQLSRSRLGIADLAFANPQKPEENALECSSIQLDFNSQALLRKNWVVDRGSLTGLQLGELRLTDGSLPVPPEGDESGTGSEWSDKMLEAGEQWFTRTGQQMSEDLQAQLQSPALAKELSQRWPAQYAELESQAKRIRDDAKQLQTDAKQWKETPWAAVEQFPQIVTRIDGLRQEGTAIKQKLLALRSQLEVDRKSVDEARRHDQRFLREKLTPEILQPEALTEYLVRSDWKPYIDQLIGWIQWGRTNLSTRPKGSTIAGRGTTIDFLSAFPEPRWLVKQLDLDGSGTANREPFTFRGVLTNFTSDPQIVQQPARLLVELAGAHQATVELTVDHTGPVPTEILSINCPRIVQPPKLLGKRDGLAMELARGTGSLGMQVKLVGEELSGQIGLVRPDVTVTPRVPQGHKAASLQTALTEAASNVKQLDVQIHLAGHWKRPAWQIRSNLGSQLADGMNQAVRSELVRRSDVLLDEADEEVQQQLSQWQTKLEEKQQQILADLNLSDQQLSWVKQQITAHVPLPGNLPANLPTSKAAVQDALRKVLR